MSYCLNPQCCYPHNSDAASYCQRCGLSLKLQNRYRPLKLIGQGGFGKTYLAIDEQIPSHSPCVIKQFFLPPVYPSTVSQSRSTFCSRSSPLRSTGKTPANSPNLSLF
jgi:serine/threonine protein kinase